MNRIKTTTTTTNIRQKTLIALACATCFSPLIASATPYEWKLTGPISHNTIYNDPSGIINSTFNNSYTFEVSFIVDPSRATSSSYPSSGDSLKWVSASSSAPFLYNGSIKVLNGSTLIYEASFSSSFSGSGSNQAEMLVINNDQIQPEKFSDTLSIIIGGDSNISGQTLGGGDLRLRGIHIGLTTGTTGSYVPGTLPNALLNSQIPTTIDLTLFRYYNANFSLDFYNGDDMLAGMVLGGLGGTPGTIILPGLDNRITPANSLTIQQIPEPSSYALLGGAVALVLTAICRRRLG